eukprot:TRINITY_DN23703_c0_g1_i1.p1 TRINITY_DN23703_c0_g1~~TRINITY_DN23703_c0_g1_i1.p1  ORF type:complete len:210 (+),score=28.45 TRINITY_DN23703_c0_g1_i1:115-744(+)
MHASANGFAVSTSIPCKLTTLHGQQYTVDVQPYWNVWKLREHVCKELGIPEYEQSFIRGLVHLRSADSLFPPLLPQPGEPLELCLVRSCLPACFAKVEIEELWQGFLAFSRDHGDTVDGSHASRLARCYAGLCHLSSDIGTEDTTPTCFSFVELLWYFSDRSWLLDVGRVRCLRWQNAGDGMLANEADSNIDASEIDEEEIAPCSILMG